MVRISLLILLLVLSGCGPKTVGKSIPTEVRIDIHDLYYSTVTIDPSVQTESRDTPVAPTNSQTFDVKPNTPISLTAPTLETALATAIESKTTSDVLEAAEKISSTPEEPVTSPIVTSESAVVSESVITDGSHQLTYTMKYLPEQDRMFVWLNETGADFGSQITLSVPDCDYTMVVEDPQNNYRDGKGVYKDGLHNTGEGNGDRASFMAPTGCQATELIINY